MIARRTDVLKARFPLRDRTLPTLLQRQAAEHGTRRLVVVDGVSRSYDDLCRDGAEWGGRLVAAGVGKNDRVALICGNRIEFLEIMLGCAWVGAVLVPINTASRGFQLQHILRNSGARLLVAEGELLASLDHIDLADTALDIVWTLGEAAKGTRADLPVRPIPDAEPATSAASLSPADIFAIVYTSGTTGLSKGVRCPHGQFFAWGMYTGRQLGLREGDVLHTTLPLFHSNALGAFFQALVHGGTVVVEKRFSVSAFWERLIASGATVTYVLGAMVPMLLSRPISPLEMQHQVRVALAPGVAGTVQDTFAARTGIGIIDGYGSSETNAVIGCTLETRRTGYMGHVEPDFEVRVVDELDAEVSDGQPGELVVRATEPFAMSDGYHGMPDKTAEAWRNLWFHSGDVVIREGDYFRFVDRAKDAIRRRGENISSFEVEQVLLSHPAIGMAAVFAVASELGEDEVMVCVVPAEGCTISPEEIIRFCEGRMSYFSVPRFVDLVGSLPRTENGKIRKSELRERGVTPTAWDRERAGIVVRR